jgi:hypothetical protein
MTITRSIIAEGMLPQWFYHGSQFEFERFIRKTYTPSLQLGFGFHFSTDESFAKLYGPNIYKVRLNVESPLDLRQLVREGDALFDLVLKFEKKENLFRTDGVPMTWLYNTVDSVHPKRAEQILKDAGYDAVWYTASHGHRTSPYGSKRAAAAESIIVLDSSQIQVASVTRCEHT